MNSRMTIASRPLCGAGTHSARRRWRAAWSIGSGLLLAAAALADSTASTSPIADETPAPPVAHLGALTLDWYSFDGGGGESSDDTLMLRGTIAQHDAGVLSGGGLTLTGGFWPGPAPPTPPCPGDLDGDGDVGGADLGLLLGAWGGDGPADLNGDMTVDGADLGLLLGKWGPC